MNGRSGAQVLARQQRQVERQRRRVQRVPGRGATYGRKVLSEVTDVVAETGSATASPGWNGSMDVGPGLWTCWAIHEVGGPYSGTLFATISDYNDPQNYSAGPDGYPSGNIVVRGPTTLGSFGRLDVVSGTPTTRTITIYARLIGP